MADIESGKTTNIVSIQNNFIIPSSIELIKFDKNNHPQYQGYCKLKINLLSNLLLVEPLNENFKDVIGFEATFKWKFIKQKNILFVFGDFVYQNFALIFNNIEKCRKTYNGIFKKRSKDYVGSELLRINFLNPFLKNAAENNFSRIKEIMEEWIEKHEGNEKKYYLKLLKRYQGNPKANDVKQEIDYKPINHCKRRFREIKTIADIDNDNSVSDPKNNDKDTESIYTDDELISDYENCEMDFFEAPFKKRKRCTTTKTIIDESKFKIVYIKVQYGFRPRLLVFTSSQKLKCYEYNLYPNKQFFFHRCRTGCKEMKAYLGPDENGKEIINLENISHTCDAIKYNPEKFIEMKIIKKPEYEILENCCSTQSKKALIIFDENDRNLCYEYTWNLNMKKFYCYGCSAKERKMITAEIYYANSVNEYIRLFNEEHCCEKRKYDPKKFYESHQFVLSPNFKISIKFKNGIERKTLIIFKDSNQKFCYSYHFVTKTNKFYCNGCTKERKKISAKIFTNFDGEDYVILSNFKHICMPQDYKISQMNTIEKEIILRPPKIKFIKFTKSFTSKLFIFVSNDDQLCYKFSRESSSNLERYYCRGCHIIKMKSEEMKKQWTKIVYANLYKDDDNGEYFVKMVDGQQHLCKPEKFEEEKYAITALKPKIDYILFQVKRQKIDTINLVIFHQKDKSLCYKYCYDQRRKVFICIRCKSAKTFTSAKLQLDCDGNEFIVEKQSKHACTALQVATIIKSDTVILKESGLFDDNNNNIDENQILRLPNFELQRNAKNGIADQKLIIFYGNNKTLCYEYDYNIKRKYFCCNKCKIIANLKIDKINGEKYIILSKNEHKCNPTEYKSDEKKIIESSNFMIFNKDNESKLTKLVTFTSSKRDTCYEYTFIKKTNLFQCCSCIAKKVVSAKLLKDENGNEFIQLLKNEHICTPKKFIFEEFQPKIIPASGFKLYSNSNGKANSKAIIFDPEKDGNGYAFALGTKNTFGCRFCRVLKKYTSAKLFENENGEKYFELSHIKHFCKSRKYDPVKNVFEKKNKCFNTSL